MPRGGARQGAGRKPRSANLASREAREKAIATGETPLDYMLRVMRDKDAGIQRRDDMAKAAAPYVHSRFAPAAPADGGGAYDLSRLSDDELDNLEQISRKIAAAFGHPRGEGTPEG